MDKNLKNNNTQKKSINAKENIGDYVVSINELRDITIDENKRTERLRKSQEKINEYKNDLFEQRKSQRNKLFNYCLISISIILFLMFSILFYQILYKMETGDDLITPSIYNTVFVSVIIQFIGIVYIIAKKLWDEKDILPLYNKAK
jgi:hypothetical protein